MILSYTTEQIEGALRVLDNIEVNGIDNCKRVFMIHQILHSPVEEKEEKVEKDGTV